jgi:hypothetical protein
MPTVVEAIRAELILDILHDASWQWQGHLQNHRLSSYLKFICKNIFVFMTHLLSFFLILSAKRQQAALAKFCFEDDLISKLLLKEMCQEIMY